MKKNFSFKIEKYEDEPNRYYLIRKIFINKKNPKTKKEFELMLMYSNILINMVFLHCRYSAKTSKIILDYLKMKK
jgi:hypothetical protein